MNFCRVFVLSSILFTAAAFWVQVAPAHAAACLPGLPCLTAPTPAQLADPSTGPNVAKNEGSEACDANFMNQIYSKAFLEAERETVVNNTLLLKPDSVLEYTCVDQDIARVAEEAGPLFSESTRWAPATIPIGGGVAPGGSIAIVTPVPNIQINVDMGNTHLDRSVERLVMESIKTYVDDSFAHDFLGGAAAGDNNSISSTVAGAGNLCDFMYNVYHYAKCDDFALNAPYSSTRFSNLVNNDLRNLPQACPSTHQITQAHIDLANNVGRTWASFDDVDVLYSVIEAPTGANCPHPGPIPTGVIVSYEIWDQDPAGNPVLNSTVTYDERSCANPACHYDYTTNTCKVVP